MDESLRQFSNEQSAIQEIPASKMEYTVTEYLVV
ncbi:Uncharacterised protein [Legionella quateirensis]|uniref:Uncharacterized protein n=1 Tax=Legionella quateirensis TaxID=45072 RepID=A0A378KNL5_9GAMM|nr:Uncharacterised protein [Legionella quateirensis]